MWSLQPEILDYLKGVTDKSRLRPQHPCSTPQCRRAHWDDAEIALARVHRQRRGVRRPVPDLGRRRAAHPARLPDIAGLDEFDGAGVPLRAVGPHRRPHGQAGRRDRHGRQRDPGGARDGQDRRRGAALSTHRRVGMPRPNIAFPPAVQAGLPLRARYCGRRCGRRSTGPHETVARSRMTKQPELLNVGGLDGQVRTSAASSRIPSCVSKLTPNYQPGCKRILNSDNYYQRHRQPEDRGDHRRHRADHAQRDRHRRRHRTRRSTSSCARPDSTSPTRTPTSTSRARGGEDLVDRWNREGVMAHRGITVADMPNLFFLLGPNTGLGHNSVVFMIEAQIGYVAQAIAAVGQGWRRRAGADARRAGPLQRRVAGRSVQHGVEHGRLPELVPRRARRQPLAVERHDVAVLAGDQASSSHRSTRSSGWAAGCCLAAHVRATRQTQVMLCCRVVVSPQG